MISWIIWKRNIVHSMNCKESYSHPRPLLKRTSVQILNGWWDFAAGAEEQPLYQGRIRVPFPPEAALSGIGKHFPEGTELHYSTTAVLTPEMKQIIAAGGRLLLHIDAADQHCRVLLGGAELGLHTGGYEHCSFDLTSALCSGNDEERSSIADSYALQIITTDDLRDLTQPYGKQVMKRGGMWYTPFSGLWQSVWLEAVPAVYVEEIRIRTDMEQARIQLILNTGAPASGTLHIMAPEGEWTVPFEEGFAMVRPEQPHLWSPEDPYLYRFRAQLSAPAQDRFESYFALRAVGTVQAGGFTRLTLNGKPYFFNGLLDQGYFSDGLCTPADSRCYDEDILAMKALGFNLLRKHIRIEPDAFYEACDRLGMLVCQDMVNNGRYSFFLDTALPTVGIQHLNDEHRHRDPAVRQAFEKTMRGCVRQVGSFPCIIAWTVFNEGWGQFASAKMTALLRELDADGGRIIDAASGWFRSGAGDVESLHVYFKAFSMKPAYFKSGRPVVLSEFGGIAFREPGHCFNPDKTYGYGTANTRREYAQRVLDLYENQILPAARAGLSAAVYTQVSDVEDEINGILTYDRQVNKLADPDTRERMRALSQSLREAVQ